MSRPGGAGSLDTKRASAWARARWAGRAVAAVIAVLLAIDAAAVVHDWSGLRPLGPGAPAPDFRLPRIDQDGRVGPARTSLDSFRGRAVIVDFWETWCPPCRESMPVVDQVVARHGGDNLVLLSVCSDGTRHPLEARRLVDELAPHAALLADDGQVADLYGVGTIPHLVVIDRSGAVVSVHRRFAGAAALDRELEEAVKEALAR